MSELMPLNDADWEITPETQAASDAAQMFLIPLKPGPNGEEPPTSVDDQHEWSHLQDENIQITNVEVGEVVSQFSGEAQMQLRLTFSVLDGPNAGKTMDWTTWWPKDQNSWGRRQAGIKARFDKLFRLNDTDVPTNWAQQVRALQGMRAAGRLKQGYEPRRKQVDGEWVDTGEFRKAQFFTSFRPLT